MRKNTAGKLLVYAYGAAAHASPGDPITGDAAQITGVVRIDGAAANTIDDTNPTELTLGYYMFDLTATETNGDHLAFIIDSSTANVNVRAAPEYDYTSGTIDVDASGRVNVGKVFDTTQTTGTDIPTVVDGIQADLSNATDGLGAIKADTAAVLVDTGTTIPASLTTIDTEVGQIKAKTDSLTFTIAGNVDSNVQSVVDKAISEGGSAPASPIGQT